MCILFAEKSFIVAGFTSMSLYSLNEVCINIKRTK